MLKAVSHLPHKKLIGLLPHLPFLWISCAVFFIATASLAAPPEPGPADEADEPVRIVSDALAVDSENMVAEFTGSVRASQKNTVIQSDRLKIYYASGVISDTQAAGGEQSVRQIIASGNVRISFDNRLAVADQAVYTASDRVLVLTGRQVSLTTDQNTISGKKIIIHRTDGRMTVESGTDKRVEAEFVTGDSGIN